MTEILITAVIPTKNRPGDLRTAVQSICLQSRKPDQLVIIDQSTNTLGRDSIASDMKCFPEIQLTYVYDPSITGLVAAKDASIHVASGDVILFLEDDVVLEFDYIREIENGFVQNDQMLGCSGVVTNPPKTSELYLRAFEIFHRGIFLDRRPRIYAHINMDSDKLIESPVLSGGLSAWRREVFEHVKFDVENGFHMVEDFEFSKRASNLFGARLFINPKARLAHYFSPSNRNTLDVQYQRKVVEWVIYFKKNRQLPFASINLTWLLVGIGIETLLQAVQSRTLLPIRGYLRGLVAGYRKRVAI